MKAGKTFKVSAKISVKDGGRFTSVKNASTVRFVSTDKSIATVTKKGTIKGRKAGTTTIYAVAHNGVRAKVKVTVK
jgi:hypothetical protein